LNQEKVHGSNADMASANANKAAILGCRTDGLSQKIKVAVMQMAHVKVRAHHATASHGGTRRQ
jgi:hypothetical protein